MNREVVDPQIKGALGISRSQAFDSVDMHRDLLDLILSCKTKGLHRQLTAELRLIHL